MEKKISIINKTKEKIPPLPISLLKDDILGKEYHISLAYIPKEEIRKLNKKWRKIDRPTNILSFSFEKNSGEILISPSVVKMETKKFERNFRELLGFLLIHGMLHLKGIQHSSKMERLERKYDKKYFNRNRHRIEDYKSSRGRIL